MRLSRIVLVIAATCTYGCATHLNTMEAPLAIDTRWQHCYGFSVQLPTEFIVQEYKSVDFFTYEFSLPGIDKPVLSAYAGAHPDFPLYAPAPNMLPGGTTISGHRAWSLGWTEADGTYSREVLVQWQSWRELLKPESHGTLYTHFMYYNLSDSDRKRVNAVIASAQEEQSTSASDRVSAGKK